MTGRTVQTGTVSAGKAGPGTRAEAGPDIDPEAGPETAAGAGPRSGPEPGAVADLDPGAANGPAISARRPVLAGIAAVLLLVAGVLGWGLGTRITGAIIVPALIEVERNRQAIQHPDGGVVRALLVYEGDHVTRGQVLLRLDPSDLASALAVTEARLHEVLARAARSEAERNAADQIDFGPVLEAAAKDRPEVAELMEGQRRLLAARNEASAREIAQLEKRSAQISRQLEGIAALQASFDRQSDLVGAQLVLLRELRSRGLAEASRVLALERDAAGLDGERGALLAQAAQAEERMTEIALQILALRTARREEALAALRDQQSEARELAEERRALELKLARLDITAPVSGIVHGLRVHGEEAVLRAAEPVMYIVPQDRPLVIAAQVDPRDIDAVHPAQDVYLNFSALDQRSTPRLIGRVTQISADVFTDDRAHGRYYRAEIVLNDGERERLPEGTALIPGMPVEAFLRTGERTPLAYLMKPFTDYFARALREG